MVVLSILTDLHSVMHRADYQYVLADEARRLGVVMRLGCDVVDVDSSEESPSVTLADGEVVRGDVIIGADGKAQFLNAS